MAATNSPIFPKSSIVITEIPFELTQLQRHSSLMSLHRAFETLACHGNRPLELPFPPHSGRKESGELSLSGDHLLPIVDITQSEVAANTSTFATSYGLRRHYFERSFIRRSISV
jgi:hypothetical protein